MKLRNKKMSVNSTLEDDSHGTFMTPSSSPVGRKQERSMNVPEAHPYKCNKIIPQLLSRIHKPLVIFLMSERATKTGSDWDHSQLASNEIKGFSTLIRLSPGEAKYNASSVLAKSTVPNEDINTSKKRKRKIKKRQNQSTSKGNEEAEIHHPVRS